MKYLTESVWWKPQKGIGHIWIKATSVTERYNITAISTEKAKYCHTMLEITKEKKDDVFACIPDYVCVGER